MAKSRCLEVLSGSSIIVQTRTCQFLMAFPTFHSGFTDTVATRTSRQCLPSSRCHPSSDADCRVVSVSNTAFPLGYFYSTFISLIRSSHASSHPDHHHRSSLGRKSVWGGGGGVDNGAKHFRAVEAGNLKSMTRLLPVSFHYHV